MGLDMYFFVEAPIPAPKTAQDRAEIVKALQLPMAEIRQDATGQQFLKFHIAFLRKANSIHGWIVREVANGVDDCNPVELSREALYKLKSACQQALERRVDEECFSPDDKPEDVTAHTMQEAVRIMIEQDRELAQRASKYGYSCDDPLRPTTGPFFGSYQKNAKYYADLQSAIQMIDLFLHFPEESRIIYRASW